MRVLLVGATGAFGSRLAGRLAGMPGLDLVLAARRRDALERLHAALAPAATATLSIAILDRAKLDLRAAELGAPDVVVDAAGPFQEGGSTLARAAIAAGAHMIDLADARAYVAAYPAAFDACARATGVLAVTGASSTPALSHAVLDDLVAGWRSVERLEVAILPGARAPRGLAVMRAILAWAGRPVRLWRGGAWREAPGWSGPTRLRVPGLGRRFASLAETPDLDLLPARFAVRDAAIFRAGLEVPTMHLGLWLLTWPVRLGLVASLRPTAPLLRHAAGLLAGLGSDRGGMLVEAEGRDGAGRRIQARWSLVAERGCGPAIPGAPAAALVRALLEGREARRGAFACVGLLSRASILAELEGLPVATRTDVAWPDEPALFRRLLGPAFDALPATVRAVHGASGRFEGHARVRAGRGRLATWLRHLAGLPRSSTTAVVVTIVQGGGCETWTRHFGTARFVSRLAASRDLGGFEERIGPLRIAFDLRRGPAGLRWDVVGWALGPVALPRRLAPRVLARSEMRGATYGFTAAVSHPLTGLIVAYRGSLTIGVRSA